jgi:hypothetical protein
LNGLLRRWPTLIALQPSSKIAIHHLAKTVAAEILVKAQILSDHPQLGRLVEGRPEYREIVLQVLNAA